MDRILISDLGVRCIIGITEEERREKQDVVISLSLFADLTTAGRTDKFADAVDYRAIKKRVLALAEESRFYLVEALAESIAAACLEQRAVQQVTVRVEKPSALRFARSVGVEITRARD
ncbi:MAG: dihydroneopterin aldolase [Armatimonadota bacterium]